MKKTIFKTIKKLSSAPCFMALLVSCGKKIESADETVIRRPEAKASVINLNIETINENQGSNQVVTDSSGWARIPSRPIIKKSLSNLVYSKITFQMEVHKNLINNTKLVCDYLSVKLSSPSVNGEEYQHQFLGCKEDIDGDGNPDELNYLPGDEIALEENQVIKFDVHTSDTTDQLSIKSEIEVDWR